MSAIASQTFTPVAVAARPAPARSGGAAGWARANLFSNAWNALATVVVVAVLAYLVAAAFDWGVLQAVFAPDADACQAARGVGACWGVVAEKFRLIIFGRYPYAEQWRPLLATAMLLGLLVASGIRAFWKRWLVVLWLVGIPAFFVLMRGNVVPTTTK